MTLSARRLPVLIVLLGLSILFSASCSSTSAPDSGTVSDAPGLAIEGVVRQADSGNPISGAEVFVVSGSSAASQRTTTDADGKFVLTGFVPGRYVIAASREGYVAPDRLDVPGQIYRLTEQGAVRDAVFSLVPAGSLAGRVLKPDGQPAAKVEIQLLQNRYALGKLQLIHIAPEGFRGRIETNAQGEFRVVGVDPGEYFIRLNPREATAESIIPGGRPPVPVLYPGVGEVAQAKAVIVSPGRETRLEDVRLVSGQRGWIRVFVVDRSGESLEGFGSWSLEPPDWIGSGYPRVQQRIVNNAHEFQPDLPGTYEISAFWRTARGPLIGRLEITYTGAPIERQMVLEKGRGSLSGSVLIEDEAGAAPRPLPEVEVSIGPDIPYVATTQPDGTFSLPEIYSGRYKLGDVRGLPPGAYILSARQGTRDVLREDLVVSDSPVSLDIVIAARGGTITGTVKSPEGIPVHNATVALVPESPLRDRSDYYGAYASARTDQAGIFELHGVTPGSYQAYAWLSVPGGAYRNASFMKPYAGKGVAVAVSRGSAVTLDLTADGPAN
jgi:protocatechuate 3,4-dioxygenase beta subunit